ncbi:hypothetical protein [Streptomyces sp. 8L]|uniref:hypothetical protein n=1 Tax=Streptomyces sp. 8L TaxID=2877242 RepID=UPI001CD456BD|nr:hypothetical protein [Streptomyces sp. 8L]MCA1218674.1 hypothetical protein [Streptomyces sp. 8L]
MTATDCQLCQQPLEAGYLCPAETAALSDRLERMPALHRQAEQALVPTAAAPLERVSSGHPGPSAPVSEAALNLWYGGIASVLERWRADIQQWRGWGPPSVEGDANRRVFAAARWLWADVEWIAENYPQAGDMAREVRRLEAEVLSVTGEAPERGRRIGPCPAMCEDGSVCGAVLRLYPGEKAARCRWCGCSYPPATWPQVKAWQDEDEKAAAEKKANEPAEMAG